MNKSLISLLFVKKKCYILRRPQIFAKSSPYFWQALQNFVAFSEYMNFIRSVFTLERLWDPIPPILELVSYHLIESLLFSMLYTICRYFKGLSFGFYNTTCCFFKTFIYINLHNYVFWKIFLLWNSTTCIKWAASTQIKQDLWQWLFK